MADRDRYDPGTPSWVDLGSPDPEASSRFYSGLFGWHIEEGPPEAGGYRMAMLRGRPVAGVGPLMNENQPPAWTTYVTVEDADATVAAARDAGATVLVEPIDVLDVGRMAIFADPSGAVLAVWQPRAHQGAGIVGEANTLTWTELLTRDVDGAKSFYSKVFGWTYDTMEMPGAPPYTLLTPPGGDSVGGMLTMGEEFPADVPPHWATYFAVDDVDAMAKKAEELGGTVEVPPFEIPTVGRDAVLAGPHGERFSVLKPEPRAPA